MEEKLYICPACGYKLSYAGQSVSYIYCDRCGSKINVDYWYVEYDNTDNVDNNNDDDNADEIK